MTRYYLHTHFSWETSLKLYLPSCIVTECWLHSYHCFIAYLLTLNKWITYTRKHYKWQCRQSAIIITTILGGGGGGGGGGEGGRGYSLGTSWTLQWNSIRLHRLCSLVSYTIMIIIFIVLPYQLKYNLCKNYFLLPEDESELCMILTKPCILDGWMKDWGKKENNSMPIYILSLNFKHIN